jgi:hypothetical protein
LIFKWILLSNFNFCCRREDSDEAKNASSSPESSDGVVNKPVSPSKSIPAENHRNSHHRAEEPAAANKEKESGRNSHRHVEDSAAGNKERDNGNGSALKTNSSRVKMTKPENSAGEKERKEGSGGEEKVPSRGHSRQSSSTSTPQHDLAEFGAKYGSKGGLLNTSIGRSLSKAFSDVQVTPKREEEASETPLRLFGGKGGHGMSKVWSELDAIEEERKSKSASETVRCICFRRVSST